METDPLPKPQLLGSEVVYSDFFEVRKDRLRNLENQEYNYFRLIVPGHSVAVLALTENQTIILNREYRHPTGGYILGLPGGYIDDKETPEQAAERELREEAGYTAENFRCVGSVFPYAGISGQKVFFVLAEHARKTEKPKRDVAEMIEIKEVPLIDVQREIGAGNMIDGLLCAGLYFINQTL